MTENVSLGKKEWLEEGIRILSNEHILDNLTVENLIKNLEQTQDSFHLHFKNLKNYTEELMKHWEETNNISIKKINDVKGNSYEKLRNLLNFVLKLSGRTIIAIRAWALYDPIVRKYQDTIDRAWIDFCYELFYSIYGDKERALNKAYKAYAGFLGYQQIKHLFIAQGNEQIKKLLAEMFDIQLQPDD